MKHRHLRKWVYRSIEISMLIVLIVSLVFCYSAVIEAFTGISFLSLLI